MVLGLSGVAGTVLHARCPAAGGNVHNSGPDVGCDCALDMGTADRREEQVAWATGAGWSLRGAQY